MEISYFLFKVYWDTQSDKVAWSQVIIEAYTLEEAEKILLNKLNIVQYDFEMTIPYSWVESFGFGLIKLD